MIAQEYIKRRFRNSKILETLNEITIDGIDVAGRSIIHTPSICVNFKNQKVTGDILIYAKENDISDILKEMNQYGIIVTEIHDHWEYKHIHIEASIEPRNINYLHKYFKS